MYDKATLDALHKNYLAQKAALTGVDPNGPQPQKIVRKQQPKTRSGLAKWAPVIGGAAAGIAAAPFTGGLSLAATLAAIGGATAVGSGLGELGAQTANNESFDLGKVGKEAAIGGALGAIPLGGVAGRGARAARAGITPAVPKGVVPKVADVGRRLESRAGGYGLGEKMTGKRPLSPEGQADIIKTLRLEKIPKGHPERQAQATAAKLKQYGDELDAALTKTNKPLTLKSRQTIANEFLAKVQASPTVDANILKNAEQLAKNFVRQAKDVKGINTFRKGVDKNAINYIANPDAATAAKQQAATVLRQHLSETVSKLAPSVKQLNGRYSKLANANDYLLQQAGRLTRQSENAGAGLTGRVLTGDVAQTVKSKVGAGLQRIPGAAPAAPGPLGVGAGTELLKQGLGRGVLAPPQMSPELPPEEDIYGTDAIHGFSPEEGLAEQPQVEAPLGLEDALFQAQQILGADQTPATYLSYAKAILAANKTEKPSAAQQKTAQATRNAENVIDEIENAYKTVGGAQGAITGTARNLAGKVRLDQDANYYNSQRQGYLSRIARAFGEVGTLSDQDIARALNLIPDLADTPQNAARKLAGLRSLLAQAQQTNVSGGQDIQALTDALLQSQGAY